MRIWLLAAIAAAGPVAAAGAAAPAAIRVGDELCGFRVRSVTELPAVAGRLWRMDYLKNGADLVWIDRDDENKTFAVAFKTIPEDDTGVAHILEHSVLCGSEKFPTKEPFVGLMKSSFSTFLNAFTSSDCTAYPVATKNGRDYLNLAEVYLDAVFRPLSVRQVPADRDGENLTGWAMRQEGWHYEYDGTNLTRNGVVLSEMKGVFGNVSRVARYELGRRLFPDNTYGKVSGGDPAHVPELTFEKYRAFYDRFYHPSNARIFLDGRIDLRATLALLDSYLGAYDRRAIDATVPRQRPVSASATVEYECDEDGDRTLLMDGWVCCGFEDRARILALEVLCELLSGSNEAPLKKALLDAGLCKDFWLFCDGYEQKFLGMKVQNTSPGRAAACRKTVRDEVARLCRTGLDARRISAILNRKEFHCREMDTANRGVGLLMWQTLDGWLYGGDPAAGLEYAKLFAEVRGRIGTGWFERVLKAALLDNPHHAEITMVPSKTIAERRRQAERAELERIRKGMTGTELAKTAAAAKWLKAHQSRPDRPEDEAKLPRLAVKDIPLRGKLPEGEIGTRGGVTVVRPEAATDGIAYLDFHFDLKGLSDDELLDVPFLASVLGELATERYKPLELQDELKDKVGRFGVSAEAYESGPRLVVRLAALESRQDEALRLAEEILLRTKYDDAAAVARLRTQSREAFERSARSHGARALASCEVVRPLSERNRVAGLFGGIDQLRRLQGAAKGDLAKLAARIFVREGLVLGASRTVRAEILDRAIALWPDGAAMRKTAPKPVRREFVGYVADGAVGYAALANRLPAGSPVSGSQMVAAKIVRLEHLWNEIRVKGGAYGGILTISPCGDVMFISIRDPNLARTFGQFRRSGEVLAAYVKSGAAFDHYQVSTAKDAEPNLSPRQQMDFVCGLHLNGRTTEDLQRIRREALTTTSADLLAFAATLTKMSEGAAAVCFGNEKLLTPCRPDRIEQITK